MTTSGVYSYFVNRDQIIRLALVNINRLDENETPTAQTVSDCASMLNMLVKQWQGKTDFGSGLKTFTRRRGHLFLRGFTGQYTVGPTATGWCNDGYISTALTANASAGQPVVAVSSVAGIALGDHIGVQVNAGQDLFWSTVSNIAGLNITLAANLPYSAATNAMVYDYTTTAQQPLKIETASIRDQYNTDYPMKIMVVGEYDTIPSKTDPTNQGDPSAIYYENQLGYANLFTDVGGASDVTKHICLTYMEEIQVFANPADTPEYPAEWYLPLALGLAKLIAPMFESPWSQIQEDNYKTAIAIAQHKEPENVVSFFQCGID